MKDYDIPKHTVIQYVRDKKGIPYGVVVATKSENGFCIGYSLCNKKDRFSKDMALKIAIARTEKEKFNFDDLSKNQPYDARSFDYYAACGLPRDIIKMIPAFTDRCKKYYKVGA